LKICDRFFFLLCLGYILLNIACGFLYGLVYGVIFIIMYAGIGLSISFYVCRFILTHNYCVIKNLKTTFDNSEIIQTLIKVLNCADGYKIIFLSRLTPVSMLIVCQDTSFYFILLFILDTVGSTKWFLFDK